MEEDRHLVPAEVPSLEPHVLIMESTYGTQKHESRDVREALFTSTIERIVQRGGRCLIPAFALGRAQELLLILDEYWKEREDLHRIPVFYASKMATRALRVYQTYINMMNQHVRSGVLRNAIVATVREYTSRNGPKSTKRPPTPSGDGDDS